MRSPRATRPARRTTRRGSRNTTPAPSPAPPPTPRPRRLIRFSSGTTTPGAPPTSPPGGPMWPPAAAASSPNARNGQIGIRSPLRSGGRAGPRVRPRAGPRINSAGEGGWGESAGAHLPPPPPLRGPPPRERRRIRIYSSGSIRNLRIGPSHSSVCRSSSSSCESPGQPPTARRQKARAAVFRRATAASQRPG